MSVTQPHLTTTAGLSLPRLSTSAPIVSPAGGALISFVGWWDIVCHTIEGAINQIVANAIAEQQTEEAAAAAQTTANAAQQTANAAATVIGGPSSGSLAIFANVNALEAGNLSGDVSTAGLAVTTLATVATPGTNTKITFDLKGRVTSGAQAVLASADYANQGTVWGALFGNAAGNPSFRTPLGAGRTVASLGSAATAGGGAVAMVTDSNQTLAAGIGSTVANGGANITPVFSDGTNWIIG